MNVGHLQMVPIAPIRMVCRLTFQHPVQYLLLFIALAVCYHDIDFNEVHIPAQRVYTDSFLCLSLSAWTCSAGKLYITTLPSWP